MIMKTLPVKNSGIVRKGFWFITFKHRYAFWFAVGVTLVAIAFAFLGVSLITAHQAIIIALAAKLKGHSYLVVFLHILIINAIYWGLKQWIFVVVETKKLPEESKLSALKFLKVFTLILFFIMALGHI